MKIRYLGHSCFELISHSGTKIITDPYTGVGYSLLDGLSADAVTVSHGHFDHNYIQGVRADSVISDGAVHAVNDVTVVGVQSYHDDAFGALRGKNIIYKITMDKLTVCHMGDIGAGVTPAIVDAIGEVDVLLIPVGGTYTVDARGAKAYVEGIRPKVVIPMHYKPKDGSLDIAPIDVYLSLCGEYLCVENGETEITEQTKGTIYMKRVKSC